MSLLNLTRMSVSGSPGTGTVTLGSAIAPYQSFAAAGAVNAASYSYVMLEGTSKFECGHGTYTSSGTAFSRDTVFDSSAGFGIHETFTSAAQIWVTALAQDTVTAGKNSFYLEAGAFSPALTNAPTHNQLESATNKVNLGTWDFDPSTNQFLHKNIRMPKAWDLGTLTFSVEWRHPTTTTNFAAVWGLQAVALRNGVAIDTAYGTAQEVTSTGGTAETIYTSAESSALTVGNSPAAQDLVAFRFYRNAASGSDTLAVAASLVGVTVYLKTNAENDA